MNCPHCDHPLNNAGNLNGTPTYWCLKCGSVWCYVGEGLWGPVYRRLETPVRVTGKGR